MCSAHFANAMYSKYNFRRMHLTLFSTVPRVFNFTVRPTVCFQILGRLQMQERETRSNDIVRQYEEQLAKLTDENKSYLDAERQVFVMVHELREQVQWNCDVSCATWCVKDEISGGT